QPREQDKVELRFAPGAAPPEPPRPGRARALHVRALAAGRSRWAVTAVQRELWRKPVLHFGAAAAPQPRAGFVTLSLANDFRHAEYRAKLLQGRALTFEPYTPTLREVVLSYKATSGTVRLDDDTTFADDELQFFHVGAFGQRREHAWLRRQLAVDDPRVPLLPPYEDNGELLIGLSGLEAGDSVSLLFKVAEGSADPDAEPPPVHWAVLCDNYWKPLAGGDGLRDGTDGFLATGIVQATIPPQAGTVNSMLPAGLLWLKAAARRQAGAVCALVGVAANAIEVERRTGGEAGRLWTPLPAGSIAKLKTPVASVKSVTQPFATYGGTTLESQAHLNLRAAERLRHRGRCITAWDYERTVLAAFPEVRKVKCLPHSASNGAWLTPGRVLVVVVPDLRRRVAVDPLQPRADAATLNRIERHLRARAPMRVDVQARNPRYERVRLDFRLRLRPGFEFNYYCGKVSEALVAHLSPWMCDLGRELSFGGAVYKSALLDFVEELPYVDYVADFRMYHLRGTPEDAADVSEARAGAPDAILVSDATHDIRPVP
ncbi:MAG: baseplate J/gp47 family protein, partial [Betaproteobacteria bacterium]|nr:baseplate J/gp47 family protein [Betaproteobacteria bacterium]